MRTSLRITASATATALLTSGLVALGASTAHAADHPVINEFSANIAGVDVTGSEYVEIFGSPNADLTGHSVLLVEGDASSDAGKVQQVLPVGALDANGFGLIDATGLQNGTQSIVLISGTAPAVDADIDADNDGVIDAGAFTLIDAVGVHDGGSGDVAYGTVLAANFDGGTFVPGGASRIPDGTDTDEPADWVRNAFNGAGLAGFSTTASAGEALNTPGAANSAGTVTPPTQSGVCGDPATVLISAVQGAGDVSPMNGQTVQIEGIVTGDFQVGGFNGYTVQEEDAHADADPATSEGIFVYAPSGIDVAVGDLVHVTGAISEFETLTELTASDVTICASGQPLPAATEIQVPLTNNEARESMLVTVPQSLQIAEHFQFARYGQLVLSTGTQVTPTAEFTPGSPEAVASLAAHEANRLILDDGRSLQNPDPAIHPNGQEFTLENTFRRGDTVTNITGIFEYRFGDWRIEPTTGAEYTATNPRPEVPTVGGSLQVASFNVLNYFTTLGDRGAQTQAEFDRQQAKIVTAIVQIDAAVVGLLEIENNDGAALSTLVAALNAQAGEDRYAAITTGALGTDAITTALIYQPSLVQPDGTFAVLDSSVDPEFNTDYHRPALAQSFTELATGATFTMAVNHFKSKGSSCDALGDPEDPNGQGNCNQTRLAAANALVRWLDGDPTGADTDNVLIMGDLNSYDREDPISAIESAGYTDMIRQFQGEDAYSYVFDGMVGYLDHALASTAMVGGITGTAVWHSNSDEAPILDYTMAFKQDAQDALWAPDAYRASDHDAVIVGLDLTPTPGQVQVTQVTGEDRYETNVHASQNMYGAVGNNVYIVSGENFPDALAAGPAAAHDGAHLLLTPPDRLLQITLDEITRLQPANITIVGGTPSVSQAVENALAEQYPDASLRRIGGADRYETAAMLATEVFGSASLAYVASGAVFPDALSASGVASALGDIPVLLTPVDHVTESTLAALDALSTANAVVVGGEPSVGTAAVQQLTAAGVGVERIGGADRFETSAMLALDQMSPRVVNTAIMATGYRFPDALSASGLAAAWSAPVLLVNHTCVTSPVANALEVLGVGAIYNMGNEDAVTRQAFQTTCA